MTDIPRIGPEEAREAVTAGRALLVCAYDEEACRKMRLEGAISFPDLEGRLPSLPKETELIFYCG